jgi:hypothetical protein
MVQGGTRVHKTVQDCTKRYKEVTVQEWFIVVQDHGVSLPELKKSTNLKIHLEPSVQDVW